MAARGRGRGRGSSLHSKERQPTTPNNVDKLKERLLSLNEGNIGTYGERFVEMVLDFSTNEDKLREAVTLIFDVVVEERDNASLGAKIFLIISQSKPNESQAAASKRTLFLKSLLSRFQVEFGQKEATRAGSIEHWLSVFSFCCEVFHRVRIRGAPISVAGKAIIKSMEWLLSIEDCDDDEIECVCTYLKTFGKELNKDQVKKVIVLLRKQAVSRKSSCKTRCVVLEVLEYRAMGWQDIDHELDEFYLDAISDAAVEDDLANMKSD